MSPSSQELLSKLKTSLPKVETHAEPTAATLHQFPDKAKSLPKSSRAPKLSVSLYQHDIDRLDTIKDFMKEQGFRNLSDSEALRLACRRVQIDDGLIDTYRAMQFEDGRRKPE